MYTSPKFFKSILLFVAFSLLLFPSCSQLEKSPLDQLDAEISKRPVKEAEKNARVNELKKMLMDADEPGPRLKLLQKICEEYKSYSFDSASKMSLLFLSSARKFGTNADIVEATILNSSILLSAGIINQAIDSLKKAPFKTCETALRAKYFFTLSKGYYELSNFNSEKSFAKVFQSLGNNFLDSAIACYPTESI
jgi:hypothetical protein